MKGIALVDKLYLRQHINLDRAIVGVGFIIAIVLILATPLKMPDPDDWAYYHGTRNFSEGHLTVNNYTQYQQALYTMERGSTLLQYLPLKYDTWVLEKAPGYVFYLIPFEKAGIPRYGNVLLALGMVIVTFVLLKRLRSERTAMIGSLLMLYTPISMVMLNRAYMDTYSSLALLVIGGGLYIYYDLERNKLTPVKGGILLFIAFFFIGWSVIARYTNLPIAAILASHLVVKRFINWRKKQCTGIRSEIIPLALGIGLPMLVILLYNYYVFGSPLEYGYSVSPYPTNFAFQYLGQVDSAGESIPLQIIRYNLEGFSRNLLIGFPLLVIGIPGFLLVLYYKCFALFKRSWPEGKSSNLRTELPWDLLLVLIGWFVFVFFLYLGYEWTAGLKMGGGFVIFDRFLLPGLFPIVIIGALIIDRFPLRVLTPVMAIVMVFGALLYGQWVLDLNILPECLTERTLESRWLGYIFPPWTPYFHPGNTGTDYFPFPLWSFKYFFPVEYWSVFE